MTKWSHDELVVLSAMFARSNMGLERATVREVINLCDNKWQSDRDLACNDASTELSQRYMESDEQQQWFAEEGISWYKRLKRKSVENCVKVWPDLFATYYEAKMWITLGARPGDEYRASQQGPMYRRRQ